MHFQQYLLDTLQGGSVTNKMLRMKELAGNPAETQYQQGCC